MKHKKTIMTEEKQKSTIQLLKFSFKVSIANVGVINACPLTLTVGEFNESENIVVIKTMMLVYESMRMIIE